MESLGRSRRKHFCLFCISLVIAITAVGTAFRSTLSLRKVIVTSSQDVLQANSLEIVDDAGKVRIALRILEGSPHLALYDKDGKKGFAAMLDGKGESIVSVGSTQSEQAIVLVPYACSFRSTSGESQAHLISEDDKFTLTMRRANADRLVLGTSNSGSFLKFNNPQDIPTAALSDFEGVPTLGLIRDEKNGVLLKAAADQSSVVYER